MIESHEKINTTLNHIELRKAIEAKVKELRSYTPKVGVFGVTGVGKSSLCNALFGKDAASVSDVAACTRQPQEILIGSDNVGIKLIDVPGVGETNDKDKEYFELYKNLLPELDLVLWVIKADDRAYTVIERAYKEILKPSIEKCPVLFVINQVDKINPLMDWNKESNTPGVEKQKNIDAKVIEVSKAFDISANYIESISVEQKYNLTNLMDKIVKILPNEKKYSVLREAKEDLISPESQESAERGVWEAVKDYAGEIWDSVKDMTVQIIADSATKVIKNLWSRITFFF